MRTLISESKVRIEKARWYLNSPNANKILGTERLNELTLKHRDLVTQSILERLNGNIRT